MPEDKNVIGIEEAAMLIGREVISKFLLEKKALELSQQIDLWRDKYKEQTPIKQPAKDKKL